MASSPYYETINLPKAIQEKPLAETNNLTLKMSYDDYDIQRFIPDPEDIFKESGGLSKDIKHLLIESNSPSLASYEEHLLDSMVTMIWASNWLEKAGSSFEVTEKICKEILLGRKVQEPSEGEPMYQEIRDNLIAKNVDNDPDHNAVLRSWKQVIQHAYALQYVTLHLSLNREPLSEEIIKGTHKILTDGIDADNEQKDKPETYSGLYRKSSVAWAFIVFPDPEDIPKRVTEAVAAFNAEMKESETKKSVDPYTLASKMFHTILNIHPFLDGNSRISRLLMNAVLLKYLRIVIPIGRDETEAVMFKEVTTRASESQFADEEHQCSDKPPFAVVNTYVAIQGRSILLELKERLLAKKNGVPFEQKSVVGYPWKTSEVEEDEENDWQKECYWDEEKSVNDLA